MSKNQMRKTAQRISRWVGSPASVFVHTFVFIASFFAVYLELIGFTEMLLILTTIVSLEAIYLAIFSQMTLNYASRELEGVSEDIEEMQVDIGELQEDVGEISEDVEEIAGDEMSGEADEKARTMEQKKTLAEIQTDLRKLANDLSKLQQPR